MQEFALHMAIDQFSAGFQAYQKPRSPKTKLQGFSSDYFGTVI
jgi:hypothetical protein